MYNFWCENDKDRDRCELCNSKGDIKLESDKKYFCPLDSSVELKLMGQEVCIRVGERLKHRPKKEAKKRSSDHFKKEILPTLPKADKRHFAKKYGYEIR